MRSTWPHASSSHAALVARVALALLAFACAWLVAFAVIARADENVIRTVSTTTVKVPRPADPKGIDAKTAIVLDAQTGLRLWSRGAERRRLIASTTKIMTALVAISRTTPGEMLTATNYRGGLGESLLGLRPGERMSAQDLITGLMLESGNDAADTLAARTASSRAAFVQAMNRRARAMGLTRTHFANPIGLDAAGNYSTASDLSQLARNALKVPRFSSVVKKAHATLDSGTTVHRITNRNPLVGKYPWATGVKTGHTLAAGYLLVGSAKKLDAQVISVVTGEPSEGARETDSAALLRFGRGFYKPVNPLKKSRAVAALPVHLQDITAKVYPRRDISYALRNGEQIAVQLDSPKEIKGPRSAGSIVGKAIVLREGKQVASVPVALGAPVPEPPTSAVMLDALGRILPFVLLGLLLVMILTFFLRRRDDRTHRPGFVG